MRETLEVCALNSEFILNVNFKSTSVLIRKIYGVNNSRIILLAKK